MVSIQHPISTATANDNDKASLWLDSMASRYSPEEIQNIRAACELASHIYADAMEITGIPLLEHAMGAATILVSMNMDADTIAAAILHAVPEYASDWQEILSARFGTHITGLVEGISRMEQIQELSEINALHHADKSNLNQAQQIESLRKMLLAMVQDIRVVLIKLAERTQTLRHLSGAEPSLQERIARETQGIFAPLANRLGVWQIKWELEDLSLRYLEPQFYKEVAKMLDERRVDQNNISRM